MEPFGVTQHLDLPDMKRSATIIQYARGWFDELLVKEVFCVRNFF